MNSAVEGLFCPTCGFEYAHINESQVVSGSGIHSVGRANERVGVRALAVCEFGHPFFLGLAEHKGVLQFYIREPLPGEVGVPYGATTGPDSFVVIDQNMDPQIPWEGDLASLDQKAGSHR